VTGHSLSLGAEYAVGFNMFGRYDACLKAGTHYRCSRPECTACVYGRWITGSVDRRLCSRPSSRV